MLDRGQLCLSVIRGMFEVSSSRNSRLHTKLPQTGGRNSRLHRRNRGPEFAAPYQKFAPRITLRHRWEKTWFPRPRRFSKTPKLQPFRSSQGCFSTFTWSGAPIIAKKEPPRLPLGPFERRGALLEKKNWCSGRNVNDRIHTFVYWLI